MSLVDFLIDNNLRIFNSEEIIAHFGLEAGEIPLIMGGSWTPGVIDDQLLIRFNRNIISTTDSIVKGVVTAGGAESRKDLLSLRANDTRSTRPLPIITPIPIRSQIAAVSASATGAEVTFDFIKIEGVLLKKTDLEKLSLQDRMRVQPVTAGVWPHKMIQARGPLTMGDAEPGT